VFADTIDALGPIYAAELGRTPRQLLTDDDLEQTHRIQPAIFAMQVGLARLWRAFGLRPAAVVGHSVGEIAAAVVAGILTLDEGARLICRRSALLERVAGAGAMAMVSLPFDEVDTRLADSADVVAAIAASPGSTVVSGTPAAVEALAELWRADGCDVRRVASDVAFHSPQMDPLLADLIGALADLHPASPSVVTYSTALTDPRAADVPRDGEYWAANLRCPVRFAAAIEAAAQDGHRLAPVVISKAVAIGGEPAGSAMQKKRMSCTDIRRIANSGTGETLT
jgi:6-methylsalicylic acid synthase